MNGIRAFLRFTRRSVKGILRGPGRWTFSPLSGLFGLLIGILVLRWLVLLSLHLIRLRPLADDYCQGAEIAANGLFAYVEGTWRRWSGDLAVVFLVGALVGLPIAHLPFAVVSLIPLLFVVSSFGALVWRQARRYVSRGESTLAAFVVSGLLFGAWPLNEVGNLGGIGIGAPIRINPTPALSLFSWGTTLIVYLFPYICMLALFCRLAISVSSDCGYLRHILVNMLLAGIVGFSGLVVAATSVGGMLLIALINLRSVTLVRKSSSIASPILTTLSCVFVAFQSPGLTARREAVGLVAADSFSTWGDWIPWVGNSLVELVQGAILNFAGLVIALSSWLLFRNFKFVARRSETSFKRDVRRSFLVLSFLLPGHVLVVAVSEAFSYRAWWHYIPMEFLTSIWFGLLGGVLASLQEPARMHSNLYFGRIGLVVTFGFLFFSAGAMSADVEKRFSEWNVGPAPSVGASDIDEEWVEACWVRLGERRELPGRVLE